MSAIPTLPVTSAPAPVLSSTISPPLTPTTPDEKADSLFPSESDGQATPLPEERFVPSAEEDARVRRKLDFIVMPLLFIGFYVFQLERGNISNALTDGFLGHVGITQDQFNTGQSLLYLGIILLEIPSNYALQWFGPQIWISFQILAFGLVATLQSLQKGYGGFLATRIALGVAECGYIPGSLYIISTFYKREELAKRNAIFFVGSGLASATTGLLAYGILPLGIKHPSLRGYQWMMIIEGCMAIFVSILFILFLPASPFNPRPMFLPIRYFNEKDQQILVARVLNDDKAKATSAKKITVKEVVSTLADWRKYPHLLLATAVISQTAAIGTYSPTLIRSFKFDSLTSNALSSVGGWIGLFMLVFMGWLSDKTRLRGPVVILAIAILLTWWITFQQVSTSDKRWLKYAFLILTHGFGQAYHPINATWLSLNCKTPQERSVGMAMFVMSANLGALIGAQLLRGDDAPLYRRGFRVCVGLTSFGLLVAILQHVQYRLSNRRIDRATVRESENVEKGEAEKPLAFRYTI